MEKRNYGLECEKTISEAIRSGVRPSVLMHACCAPCSSYVLEYLEKYFEITLYYYNPNITDEEEFTYRYDELLRFREKAHPALPDVVMPGYDPSEFFGAVKGREQDREGGERCHICYSLRLEKTAKAAKEGNFDYFCTTLSISPYKNSQWLNEIGASLSEKYGVPYLFSDFKKKNGYKRSCELSEEYGLYRQNYCGCIFSKTEAEKRQVPAGACQRQED